MEREKTRLIEEGNTIYEIDLECMEKEKKSSEEQDKEKEPGF